MEHFCRVAIWVFFFVGYLEARSFISKKPEQSINRQETQFCFEMADLGFGFLPEVSCEQHITFISPTNVLEHCYGAALRCFKEGLEHAGMNCADDQDRIGDTWEALKQVPELSQAATSECKWEEKQFAPFVKDLQTFVEKFNMENPGKC